MLVQISKERYDAKPTYRATRVAQVSQKIIEKSLALHDGVTRVEGRHVVKRVYEVELSETSSIWKTRWK